MSDKIGLSIVPENEIHMEFVRSQGPGGQNVNKVSTGVHLKFNIIDSPSLTDIVKKRLIRIAGKRVDSSGVLHIQASSFRTQLLNREDAVSRLNELVKKANVIPKKRLKTRPTAASKEKKLLGKRIRSKIKEMRKHVSQREE